MMQKKCQQLWWATKISQVTLFATQYKLTMSKRCVLSIFPMPIITPSVVNKHCFSSFFLAHLSAVLVCTLSLKVWREAFVSDISYCSYISVKHSRSLIFPLCPHQCLKFVQFISLGSCIPYYDGWKKCFKLPPPCLSIWLQPYILDVSSLITVIAQALETSIWSFM